MPRRDDPLFLHEEILLLALRDQTGTIAASAMYAYSLGGALLAELLLAQRIAVEEGKKKLVNLLSDQPFGEPLLDECLEKVATAKRRATSGGWVQRFTHLKNLKHRVAQGLCDRRILRADEDTVLLIFRRKIYPELDPRPERKLIERLRRAIFRESRQVDPRTVILIALANTVGLLRIPFDKRELKARKARIEQLTSGELMGAATREAVQAAVAVVMTACTTSAIAGATAAR